MFKPLSKGDKVSVVAPSGVLHPGDLDPGITLLESWGLEVSTGDHVYDADGFFAASDKNRLNDLQSALEDESSKAVIMGRGGYGIGRILDNLDLDSAIKQQKCLVGFSDITLLHCKVQREGFVSIHGPMVKQLNSSVDAKSASYLKSLLFGSSPGYEFDSQSLNRTGTTQAKLTGGNLALLVNNIGTKTHIDYSGSILFLEDIGEPIYSIDRMFNHLERAGQLQHLAGLVLGEFTDTRQTTPRYTDSLEEVIRSYVDTYDYPVAFGFPAGHGKVNYPLVLGAQYRLEVSSDFAHLEPDF